MKESAMADTAGMTGKTVLVTGGTGGIGKATAVGLAVLGARVGITGRDRVRAEAAVADIRAASGNLAVDVFTADLSAQAQVRRLAGEVLDTYPRLDVLGRPVRPTPYGCPVACCSTGTRWGCRRTRHWWQCAGRRRDTCWAAPMTTGGSSTRPATSPAGTSRPMAGAAGCRAVMSMGCLV
jgi:hypothetical protein